MANHTGWLHVTVCYALPGRVWLKELRLPTPVMLIQALHASGFAEAFPGIDPWRQGVGIFGHLRSADALLCDGDRIEIYRPLMCDPKESRCRRAEHRRAQKARESRGRP
jgi:putative ubiquitin-RnfH superfamily antitoxin RatB of RatAB toxin-antitoxin module